MTIDREQYADYAATEIMDRKCEPESTEKCATCGAFTLTDESGEGNCRRNADHEAFYSDKACTYHTKRKPKAGVRYYGAANAGASLQRLLGIGR